MTECNPSPKLKKSSMEKRYDEARRLGMPLSIGEPNVSPYRAAELWLAGYRAAEASAAKPRS